MKVYMIYCLNAFKNYLTLQETGAAVNAAKTRIDDLNNKLGLKKVEPAAAGDIVDSEQYALLQELKAAKMAYRTEFDKLRDFRLECVHYTTVWQSDSCSCIQHRSTVTGMLICLRHVLISAMLLCGHHLQSSNLLVIHYYLVVCVC